MSENAWDFGVAAVIQLLRTGISYLKVDAQYTIVLDVVTFSLAVLEGAILSDTLPDQRRLTFYPAILLFLRLLFDFISGASTRNAALGLAGTLTGLILGPVFHSTSSNDDKEKENDKDKEKESSTINGYNLMANVRPGYQSTPGSTPRRHASPSKPVMHHVIDVDSETSRPVTFTPAMSLRSFSMEYPSTSDEYSRTRVDDSFTSGDETITFQHLPDASETVYQDAIDSQSNATALAHPHASGHPTGISSRSANASIRDQIRKLRAQAKTDDINRRALLQERDKVLLEGDVARAFMLKHQAESLKKSMVESDKEAAQAIFDYYNPPERKDNSRIDLRGLQAAEAIKFCDASLQELQQLGGNSLTVFVGRGKNADGTGKGKVKPTLRQYAKAQGIDVREIEDGAALLLSLPTMLRSPATYEF